MKTLAEMSWVQAEQALSKTDLAIIPVGAVEVYGPHMPEGSDGFAALEFSKRLAERAGAVVAPLVPVGCSQSLMSFPGTLTVSPESLKAYLTGICESLVKWNIKRILFVNGHAGNVPIIADICRAFIAQGIQCAQIDWWRGLYQDIKDLTDTGDVALGHAGEVCTSILLAAREDLVDLAQAVREKPERGLVGKYPEVLQYDRPFRLMTASGVSGDPTTASREKGERMMARFLDRIEAFLQEWR